MTARGGQTRAKLIEATIQVVREVGYARATTRVIAERAGVAEGTIYRHFPDKRQLFFAAVQVRNQAIFDAVAHLPARAGTGTIQRNLVESLSQLAGLRNDVLPLELALRTDPDLVREHRQAMAAASQSALAEGPPGAIAAYLAAEQALGRIRRDVDPVQVAIVVLATLFGLAMTPDRGDDEPGVDGDLIEAAVGLLVFGLISPPE